MIEVAFFTGGFFSGLIVGYVVCAVYLGEKIEELRDEIETYTDRDEHGRFKKSMRKLKYD